jgi:hypothetical protein
MHAVALKMLMGDCATYLGMIIGLTCAALLILRGRSGGADRHED